MIQVDDRAGSAQLAPLLKSLGVPVELTRMPFGDVAFWGQGADGVPVTVGIEVKSLGDVIACIQSGRFAGHQLPGLIQSYDHVWLLIEGEYRGRAKDGVLEYLRDNRTGGKFWAEAGGGQRQWLLRDLEGWLMSMQIMGGLRVHNVRNWQEGAIWLKSTYTWFQRDEHKSHLVVYSGKQLWADEAILVKPSLVRRVAAELPGVGVKKSSLVASRFKTMDEMVIAGEREWREIEGIGKQLAQQIVKAIHGGNGNGKH